MSESFILFSDPFPTFCLLANVCCVISGAEISMG